MAATGTKRNFAIGARRPLPALSPIGLGAHTFPRDGGEWYGSYYGKKICERVDYRERRAVVDRARELGVKLIACDFPFETELTGRILGDLGPPVASVLTVWAGFGPPPEGA